MIIITDDDGPCAADADLCSQSHCHVLMVTVKMTALSESDTGTSHSGSD